MTTPASALVGTGAGAVLLGGLVAAVTDPLDLERGSWLAAYLVLVAGVGQVAFGHRRRLLPSTGSQQRSGWAQWACWNLGGVGVMVGTVSAVRPLVDLGSALVLVSLLLAFQTARAEPPARTRSTRYWSLGYRALLVVLTVSVPIGIILSHVRHP